MGLDAQQTIDDFCRVAGLAGVELSRDAIMTEHLEAPYHSPSSLPSGKMAVYVFLFGDQCLKVGKAGPRSQARYRSHHYNPRSSSSNLANSILSHQNELGLGKLDESTIKDWIKEHTDRFNFLIDSHIGIPILSLLEAFLQCRLHPRFG